MRLWIIITMLLLALGACDGGTPREHCEAVALLTYAPKYWNAEGFGSIKTEKVCIVAIKPLER